ncbi:MAG: DUF790 family protein, partial [Sandaracinaceae bacterium]|nr:DUF790 family protein [Sandaracinaceae bacterium]
GAALDVARSFVGRTVGERDRAMLHQIRALGAAEDAVLEGMALGLARRARARVVAELEPLTARRVAFAHAARRAAPDRHAALSAAAAELATTPEIVARSLFADRPQAKILVSGLPPTARAALEAYNLALVESVLLRAEKVVVHLDEDLEPVVRFARGAGLIASIVNGALEVSGPLAILRRTTKYGHALAKFFPSLLASPGSWLLARCVLGEVLNVRIRATDPFPHRERPRDRPLDRKLVRALFEAGFAVHPHPKPLLHEERTIVPDFTLERDGRLLHVEVLHAFTPELLASRTTIPDLLVCVDTTFASEDLPAAVLQFERRLDPRELLRAACERTSNTENGWTHPHAGLDEVSTP